MKAISSGASKEIEALGIGIMPSNLAICLLLLFLVFIGAVFIKNIRK